MARAIQPATHLTPAQIDAMREACERAVLIECARSTKKVVYLKAGPGPDSAKAGINSQIVNSLEQSELVARALLPDTDLNAGAVAYDQWLTAALVAGTEYQFVNQQIRTDQVVAIYGVATLSATPSVGRVRCLVGTSIVQAAWDTFPLWAAQDTVGIADEFPMWGVQETISIWLMPFITQAGGERFILLGFVAEPKGTGPITK